MSREPASSGARCTLVLFLAGQAAYPPDMFGLLNVHKPPGPTSHDVVARARKLMRRRVKVGHAGTLDPFAEGVLVLCVGSATRLAEYVQRQPKRYTAEVYLGATSDTDDPEGEITETPGVAAPAPETVAAALSRFVGDIRQVPPVFSAVHVGGERAYHAARAGKRPDLPARTVTVYSIDVVGYDWPVLQIDVRCASGTYIRALARDIGQALGVGGYCRKLVRTEVGPFRLNDTVALDDIDPARRLLPPTAALESLPRVTVSPQQGRRLALGQSIRLAEAVQPGELAVLDAEGALLAIAEVCPDGRTCRPVKVFTVRR